MTNWTEKLTDEQKEQVWDFIVFTVKEIREQIALDIEYTYEVWATHGKAKSRQTKKAFMVSADIARAQASRLEEQVRRRSWFLTSPASVPARE